MKRVLTTGFDFLSLLALVPGLGRVSGSDPSTHLPSQRVWGLVFVVALLSTVGCGSPVTAPTTPKVPVCHAEVDVAEHDVCELQYVYPSGYRLVCTTVPATMKQVCK